MSDFNTSIHSQVKTFGWDMGLTGMRNGSKIDKAYKVIQAIKYIMRGQLRKQNFSELFQRIYYTHASESHIRSDRSLLLTTKLVPIVTLIQEKTVLLHKESDWLRKNFKLKLAL